MSAKETTSYLVLWTMALFMGLSWDHLWVQPHDEFMGQMMDCVGNGGQMEYNACVAETLTP